MGKQHLKNNYADLELQKAKSCIDALLRAAKMCSVYPLTHTNTSQAIKYLHESLETFIRAYGELSIEVKKDQLNYTDAVLFQGAARDGEPAYILFRDGIRWLSFLEGIQSEEIEAFIRLLNQYRNLPAEAEDDLVTALWEANLPHIHYKAVESFLNCDNSIDALGSGSSAPCGPVLTADLDDTGNHAGAPELFPSSSPSSSADGGSSLSVTQERQFYALTDEEMHKINEMVAREETLNPTSELLDVLEDLLHNQQEEHFFSLILEFLCDELKNALTNLDWDIAIQILGGFHHIYQLAAHEMQWALGTIEETFAATASPEFLGVIRDMLNACDPHQVDQLKQVILMMPPPAMPGFVQLAPYISSPALFDMVTEVLKIKASRDLKPLTALTDSHDEKVIEYLIDIIKDQEGEKPAEMLLNMTHCKSEHLLLKILRVLTNRNIWSPDGVFSLMESESTSVRHLLLKYLGTRKCPVTEKLLINYLREQQSQQVEKGYLFACFRTLGRCGSNHSLGFLRDVLCNGWLLSKFTKSVTRQGAVIALQTIGTEEAQEIITDAARSFFPGIRNDVQMIISPLKR